MTDSAPAPAYRQYYDRQCQEGEEFQDFALGLLYRMGLPVVVYASQKYQYGKGESLSGVEFKYDKKMKETGNLYIETHEKRHPSKPTFVPAGILRDDNTWLWVQGDYEEVFLFPKKYLRHLHMAKDKRGAPRYRRVEHPTSKGFLLPYDAAHRYAIKILHPRHNQTTP